MLIDSLTHAASSGNLLEKSDSPVEIAWAAYDAAALEFYRMSERSGATQDTECGKKWRLEKACEVARLWCIFRDLYLAEVDPGAGLNR